MREKDQKMLIKYIQGLILRQKAIQKLSGITDEEVTIAFPKVADDDKALVLNILGTLGYEVLENSFQEVNSTMLITVIAK